MLVAELNPQVICCGFSKFKYVDQVSLEMLTVVSIRLADIFRNFSFVVSVATGSSNLHKS